MKFFEYRRQHKQHPSFRLLQQRSYLIGILDLVHKYIRTPSLRAITSLYQWMGHTMPG